MFKVLSSRGVSSDLLHSQLYDEVTFYNAFSKDVKRAQSEIVMESPFMTPKRSKEIAVLFVRLRKRGVKVSVYTRNPNHHDNAMRIQAAISIKILKDTGVKVIICNDLRHRKIAVIDKQILWEGSLNFLSHNNSREVMRRTDSAVLSKQMLSFTGLNRWVWW